MLSSRLAAVQACMLERTGSYTSPRQPPPFVGKVDLSSLPTRHDEVSNDDFVTSCVMASCIVAALYQIDFSRSGAERNVAFLAKRHLR